MSANHQSKGPETGIVYPTIEVPGRGTYTVKFGLGALYTLEADLGMTPVELYRQVQGWLPRKDAAGNLQPGNVSQVLLLKILSACLWDQIQISPRELADAFAVPAALSRVATVVAEALTKTPWSGQTTLREPATSTAEQSPAPMPN